MRFYLYPPAVPWLTQGMVEAAVLREKSEMGGFNPEYDKGAEIFDLEPGHFVSWPQNAPHRIVNGDDLNVSISMEFLTARALLRANQHYANGLLRKRGRAPSLAPDYSVRGLSKAALARAMKAVKPKPTSEPWTPSFDLSVMYGQGNGRSEHGGTMEDQSAKTCGLCGVPVDDRTECWNCGATRKLVFAKNVVGLLIAGLLALPVAALIGLYAGYIVGALAICGFFAPVIVALEGAVFAIAGWMFFLSAIPKTRRIWQPKK